jgi:ABC-type cobalamin/Fe3+-siderophores transport system ATPase subunit
LAIELRQASSEISFSQADPEPQRASFGDRRINELKLGKQQYLARVMFSDSHTLSTLGKNAQGNRRMTRIKMDSPSFWGLRVALEDSDARIRLEDEVPSEVPYLLGFKLEGGFLDGQIVHLSRNLNCIIGGRGAGKSTMFEAVRTVCENASPSKIVDSEIWPEILTSVWVDEAGQQHTVVRRIRSQPENLDDPFLGPVSFAMDAYGQNETAQTSVNAQSNPYALLQYLDQFIRFGNLRVEQQAVCQALLDNQTQIEKAQLEVAKIPDYARLLSTVQQQLKAIEKAKATEIVSLERKVADERTLRAALERKIGDLSSQSKQSTILSLIGEFRKLAPTDPLRVGATEYATLISLIDQFEGRARTAQASMVDNARILSDGSRMPLDQWKTKEQQIVEQIETKRKELAAQGVKLDIAYIRKLAADEADYKKNLTNLMTWEPYLKDLKKARMDLLKARVQILSKITAARTAYAIKASRSLKGTLGDLELSVKFAEGSLSTAAEDALQRAMSWKTVQVPRAALLIEQVTVPRLLEAVRRSDPTPLLQVKAVDNSTVFTRSDALEIIKNLSQPSVLFELERCDVDDRPKITVTKVIYETGKAPRAAGRDFTRLSLGQQQSILLSLMLLSDSPYPLIIDQPEDNLDSEFIYQSLVPVLRRAKERRQIIIVTHNANIAVLGDAEQIIALKSTSDKSSIVAKGSIDNSLTKAVACQILEGSEEAFRRRAKIYGIPP